MNEICTHLGRDVVWCSAESPRRFVAFDSLFAHSKVGDFDVAFRVEHHVVQFEVPEKKIKQHFFVGPLDRQCNHGTRLPCTVSHGIYFLMRPRISIRCFVRPSVCNTFFQNI